MFTLISTGIRCCWCFQTFLEIFLPTIWSFAILLNLYFFSSLKRKPWMMLSSKLFLIFFYLQQRCSCWYETDLILEKCLLKACQVLMLVVFLGATKGLCFSRAQTLSRYPIAWTWKRKEQQLKNKLYYFFFLFSKRFFQKIFFPV